MKYSVCYLAYNEKFALPIIVEETYKVFNKLGISNFEIIVINDSSSDGTLEVLDELRQIYPNLRVFSHEQNMGYAMATLSAIKESFGEWVFIIDGDGQHPPGQIKRFLPYCSNQFDLILPQRTFREESMNRKFASLILLILCKVIIGYDRKDVNGGIKAIRLEARDFFKIEHQVNLVNPELWVRAKIADLNLAFVNVEQLRRLDGTKSRVISNPFESLQTVSSYLWSLRKILRTKD